MKFPKFFPDQLKEQIAASEVIGKKVALKKRGKEYLGLCPFHAEHTPSFSVNDQKGFYHCFGCGVHGDIITFTIEKEGLSFPEAVLRLAGDFGIAVPQLKEERPGEEDQLKRSYLLLEKI